MRRLRFNENNEFTKVIILILLTSFAKDAFAQSITPKQYIHKAYKDWVKATNAKDIKSWSSFLAPEAIFHPPNHSALIGNVAIKKYYLNAFADENFSLECIQEKIEISETENFAWSIGSCYATFTDSDGKLARTKSKWVKVWERLANGEWKCKINSWNSTQEK